MLFLFDIDGTLVGTAGAGLRALDRAFVELHGVAGAIRGIAADGKTDPLIVEEMFQAHLGRAPGDGEIDALIDRYVEHLAGEVARSERYTIYPGVVAALDLLAERGLTLGLATGNVERGAAIKLTRGDLWRRFPFGGYGSDAADRAALVARAIARGEAHARRAFARKDVVIIGDTPRDVAAAHANGAVAWAVATGPHRSDALRAAGADVVMETLEEMPERLA
ncbi:MAG TPA: HAD hydrolase-like protein [Haliangiales bacterium]|nr:HAD hydrolase-like protein [Haliangiales bacterium]